MRFSFVQEYFDLICSNVNDYSIANAVAASSAVPFIFTPVVLENHDSCESPHNVSRFNDTSAHMRATQSGLASYSDKKSRPYIHLIDGGITDNLGLLAIYDIVHTDKDSFEILTDQVEHIMIISVDAATKPDWNIDSSPSTPKATNMLGAVTDIQLHRYNDMSKKLVVDRLWQWQSEKANRTVQFIDITLQSAADPDYMNTIPTDFKLDDSQVDALIQHGYQEVLKIDILGSGSASEPHLLENNNGIY